MAMAPMAMSQGSSCSTTHARKMIRGTSMAELLQPEEAVDAELGYYVCHPVQRGDIVLVQRPGRTDPIIKLVLVLPGDHFALRRDGGSYLLDVNGTPLTTPRGTPYRFAGKRHDMLALYEDSMHGVVPAHTFFVFGTQPQGTLDSTQFGPVTESDLIGRVTMPEGTPRPRP